MFVLNAAPAAAQNDTAAILNRINQLDNQVQTLSRAVYRGDKGAAEALASGSAAPAPAVAGFDARMSALEEQQRALTGKIEKMMYDIDKLKSRFERLQADVEQRFQEAGGRPASSVSSSSSGGDVQSPPPVAAAPVQQLGTLSSAGSNGPSETLYEKAFSDIREGKYDQAEDGFKQFISQYPGHPLASNAQYWLGETYYVRGDFKQAARVFAQGYQNFPKSPKAYDSLLKLGLSLSKLGRKEDACLSLKQLQADVTDGANALRRKADAEIKQLGCP